MKINIDREQRLKLDLLSKLNEPTTYLLAILIFGPSGPSAPLGYRGCFSASLAFSFLPCIYTGNSFVSSFAIC